MLHLALGINAIGIPVCGRRGRDRVARRQVCAGGAARRRHILHSRHRVRSLRRAMAHFGVFGGTVGIRRRRCAMIHRPHIRGVLVRSLRLGRTMAHCRMFGRAGRGCGLAIHVLHIAMVHLLHQPVCGRIGCRRRLRRRRRRRSGRRGGCRSVHRMIHRLSRGGNSEGQRRDARKEERDPGHSPSPFGRTLTTRIIPACIW